MTAHLLECTLRSVLMAAATAAVLRCLRIQSAASLHAAWTAVLVVMLAMPFWTSWGPKLALPLLPETQQPALEAALPEVRIDPRSPRATPPNHSILRDDESFNTPKPAAAFHWRQIVFACYVAGLFMMLVRLMVGTAHARTLIRRATSIEDIYASPDCAAPVTLGWLRPVMLLPANWRDWPAAELDAVLIHEREHVRRRDPLIQWLASLNRAIFWFNPFAWWLERKLADLAEDACDDAVLQAGHDPRAYSEVLIDLARAVESAGARLIFGGTGLGGGGLAKRIHRILEHRPEQHLASSRVASVVTFCGIAFFSLAACNLALTQKPSAGQLSMNELQKHKASERQKQEYKNQVLMGQAKAMTPQQAVAKVMSLKANPQNEHVYYQLMRYYEFHSDPKGKDALILWYIEHQPNGGIRPWNINPVLDRAAYDRGKQLWLAHLGHPGTNATIYERAAAFFEGGDKPLAEKTLLEGREAYPKSPSWARQLGEHYAMAILGAAEPRTEYNVVRIFSSSEAQSSYAQEARVKLEKSTDSGMLRQAAMVLMFNSSGQKGYMTPDDAGTLAESLALRAVALDPTNESSQAVKYRVLLIHDMWKVRKLAALPLEEQKGLGDQDHLLLIRYEMQQAWSPSGRTPNFDLVEAKARETLALAERVPNIPQSRYAVFEANIMLGKSRLRQGHRRAAVHYLLAAADAPPSDELHYDGNILMDLPRALVDWGERDAVAIFLDKLAPKTLRTKQLQDWAAQIRKGENPDLIPLMSGCSQEPC